jgi:hypothetical protein
LRSFLHQHDRLPRLSQTISDSGSCRTCQLFPPVIFIPNRISLPRPSQTLNDSGTCRTCQLSPPVIFICNRISLPRLSQTIRESSLFIGEHDKHFALPRPNLFGGSTGKTDSTSSTRLLIADRNNRHPVSPGSPGGTDSASLTQLQIADLHGAVLTRNDAAFRTYLQATHYSPNLADGDSSRFPPRTALFS